jgi:hypothetical protein
MYFITPWQLRLLSYTYDNLLNTFKDTHLETIVHHFLKTHKTRRRNPKTKRLLLLELLSKIDP